MKRHFPSRAAARHVTGLSVVACTLAGLLMDGCLDRPLCASMGSSSASLPEGFSADCKPLTTNVFVEAIRQERVDKIDLLFMIDNSQSMGDKQAFLKQAVPDLVKGLVNPACLDADGVLVRGANDGLTAQDECPQGLHREFQPVRDIHVGVISSSLGTYSDPDCSESPLHGAEHNEEQNDLGHLVGTRPRALGLDIARGFLSWSPSSSPNPDDFGSLVEATGDLGCGYEASLEAWYRFLVDPSPPAGWASVPCASGTCVQPQGVDEELLRQRNDFLRPNSLVAVVMLTDENDCSLRGSGIFPMMASDHAMPRASSACSNPNDPCCYACPSDPPEGCPVDPSCAASPWLDPDTEDSRDLRCFEQKRRFGMEFLYPTERYVNALSKTMLCPTAPDLDPDACAEADRVQNPLFTGQDGAVRGDNRVFLAGIIGVPWQDLAADVGPNGEAIADGELHFLTAAQMRGEAKDGIARDTWSVILGHPEGLASAGAPVLPLDSLMQESTDPRGGQNPATGETLQSPEAPYMANSINGHERNIARGDDLQYACIFELPTPWSCDDVDDEHWCDCRESQPGAVDAEKSPLCQQPTGAYSTVQTHAKAYPGLRHLEVLRGLGDSSIVASICPRNVADARGQDYGYRPAMDAIVDRLKAVLNGSCLPRELDVEQHADGTLGVPCTVLEAVPDPTLGCARPGRSVAGAEVFGSAFRRLEQQGRCGEEAGRACDATAWTLCAIDPATQDVDGDHQVDCMQDRDAVLDVGWCYVDPDRGLGDEGLVANCPASERRMLRFVDPDDQTPATGGTVLIACQGKDLADVP